ncbi:MAG: hypothetical protein WB821_04375, partial [Burkholderiaceae bacterium]
YYETLLRNTQKQAVQVNPELLVRIDVEMMFLLALMMPSLARYTAAFGMPDRALDQQNIAQAATQLIAKLISTLCLPCLTPLPAPVLRLRVVKR